MAGSAADLFWTLFAFSSIVFLMPYLMLFPAFLKLRKIDPNLDRPYRVPGGRVFGIILAVICELFILLAAVFFVYVPGQAMDWSYAGPILIGVVLTLIVGEVLIAVSKKNKKAAQDKQS
jgi:amino acid transporter